MTAQLNVHPQLKRAPNAQQLSNTHMWFHHSYTSTNSTHHKNKPEKNKNGGGGGEGVCSLALWQNAMGLNEKKRMQLLFLIPMLDQNPLTIVPNVEHA